MDTLESLANAAIGLVVSWVLTLFVLGYSASGSLAVTLMFFVSSFIRSRILRAIFRRLA